MVFDLMSYEAPGERQRPQGFWRFRLCAKPWRQTMGTQAKGRPPQRTPPCGTRFEESLLALSCLVARADLLPGLGENALRISGVGAGGRQFQIFLVSLGATRRQE